MSNTTLIRIFNTLSQPGLSTLTYFDGNIDRSMQIGYKIWTVDNLKVKHYWNGNPVSNVISDDE
jgi:hypothetical protein